MGIKGIVKKAVGKAAGKAGDAVAKVSALSPAQLAEVEEKRAAYLAEMPSADDPTAIEFTSRLIAAAGIEIYSAYLPQIGKMYVPLEESIEYGEPFKVAANVRYLNITKWVIDPEENSLEKLVNVYDVLAGERCNIALIFNRTCKGTMVYLGVVDTLNSDNNVNANSFMERIEGALRGNFPGSEWFEGPNVGSVPCLRGLGGKSVASVSNVPTEKSEKFVSQTIEKLLDGMVPRNAKEEYTLILLASPAVDVEERKLRLQQLYTGLAPYASWQTTFTYQETDSKSSSATVGMNAGLSVGQQVGNNQSLSAGDSVSDSASQAVTDTEGESQQRSNATTETDTTSHTDTTSESVADTETVSADVSYSRTVGASAHADARTPLSSTGVSVNTSSTVGVRAGASHAHGVTQGTSSAETAAKSLANSVSDAVGRSTSRAVSNTLGRAVTRSLTNTVGSFASQNLGGNFGVNFARTSTVTATIGKNEGIQQTHTNYAIKHALELLEKQMARLEQGTALGLWDFAAYVLSEDHTMASNVAHAYLALTQGEESFMSQASVNLWRGDVDGENRADAICSYLKNLRQPIFGINPVVAEEQPNALPYPAVVTATTTLTGKELARSLNFPRKAVAGLPVFECASFGRNVATFDERPLSRGIRLGSIYHMHREEPTSVLLDKDSLASHVFVTGSTGAGKSNAIYHLLEGAVKQGVGFLVVEPAKGEYKDVFGNDADVNVFGTNPNFSPLLKLDPFSFPKGMHVLEHLDRLIEIFNVCWPMYAAMPAVLKSAVERAYEDCGWELTASKNPYGEGLYPTFADVARNVRKIIDSSEYDAENKGAYKGSLLTRLSSLTTGINGMVFASDELDAETLFDGRTIVDLSRVGSSETKALLMGILVLKLQEHRMTQGIGHNAGLRHLTVLEEAHNLLRRTSTEQPAEGGNLLGKSVEMLANAIAEMRTYGEGFVIADQAPGLLDASVIRNTNTKIVMRLPEGDDRALVGGAEALTEAQTAELARLPRGVAAVYQNDWIEAVLCKTDKAEHGDGAYEYEGPVDKPSPYNASVALEIASLLIGGAKIDDYSHLADVDKAMSLLGATAYARVLALKALKGGVKPMDSLRLGPAISALFPAVREAVVQAYRESSMEPRDWTLAAQMSLCNEVGDHVETQLSQAVIQVIVTDYLHNDLNDARALNEWRQRGQLL